MFKQLCLLGLVVVGLSGCGTSNSPVQTNVNNTITTTNKTNTSKTVPGATHAEPIRTALQQVNFHVKVPSYFPFKVTSSFAFASSKPGNPKVVRQTLYYLNKDTGEFITEMVINEKTTHKISGTTKKLSNGLTAMVDNEGFTWSWTDKGVSYEISATKKSASGKYTTPKFSPKEMEKVVASMK